MEHCETCGAKIVKYWHSLNKPLCSAIIKIYRLHGVNKYVKVSDLGFTHNQLANFQKLRYWGLVRKMEEEPLAKGGFWCITDYGEMFVKGEIRIPKRVETYRSKATGEAEGLVLISDIVEGYQYKKDYVMGAKNGST